MLIIVLNDLPIASLEDLRHAIIALATSTFTATLNRVQSKRRVLHTGTVGATRFHYNIIMTTENCLQRTYLIIGP